MKKLLSMCLLLLVASFAVAAASAKERRFIYVGMSEGEVLEKIGKPDSESIDTGADAKEIVKRWIYLPTADDPQTVTTVVLQKGKVIEVTREISR